jgi:hypothetical protein
VRAGTKLENKTKDKTKDKTRPARQELVEMMTEELELVAMRAGEQLNTIRLVKGNPGSVPKPPIGTLPRLAMQDHNRNVLQAYTELQMKGHLTGPTSSIAPEVVVFFRSVVAKLRGNIVQDMENIKRKIVDSFMKIVAKPIKDHEVHLSKS